MNLVRESISFERGKDPKDILDIGLRSVIRRFLEEKEGIDKDGKISDDVLLLYSCKYGKTEWVKFLIDKGADVNCFENGSLKWAVEKKYIDIIDLLLKAGADSRYLNKEWSYKQEFEKMKKVKIPFKYPWKK
jgi:ankyrin repeat protein